MLRPLQQEIERLEQKLKKLIAQRDELKTERRRLIDLPVELSTEISEDRLNTVGPDLQSKLAEITAYESELQALRQRLPQAESRVAEERLAADISEKERKQQDRKAEITRLTTELGSESEIVDAVTTEKYGRVADLKRAWRVQESELTVLTAKLAAIRAHTSPAAKSLARAVSPAKPKKDKSAEKVAKSPARARSKSPAPKAKSPARSPAKLKSEKPASPKRSSPKREDVVDDFATAAQGTADVEVRRESSNEGTIPHRIDGMSLT